MEYLSILGGDYVHIAMCLVCLCFDLARWASRLSCPHYFIRWNLLYSPLPHLYSSFSPIFKPLLFTQNPCPSFFLKSLGQRHTFAALFVFLLPFKIISLCYLLMLAVCKTKMQTTIKTKWEFTVCTVLKRQLGHMTIKTIALWQKMLMTKYMWVCA